MEDKEIIVEKYKILYDDARLVDEHCVHRIQALINFSDVKEGDKGGWVESYSNLSQDGDCWVYDNATVYGGSKVYENACVKDKSIVGDYSKVYGNACIKDNAIVIGYSVVCDNSIVGMDSILFNEKEPSADVERQPIMEHPKDCIMNDKECKEEEEDKIVKEIEIPDCYELDETESTLLRVVFKKKKTIKCYDDIKEVEGFIVNSFCEIRKFNNPVSATLDDGSSRCVALTKKVAKSMIAMAKISQLMPYYDVFTDSEFEDRYFHCFIPLYDLNTKKISIEYYDHSFSNRLLIFHTEEKAKEFVRNNEQLVKDYLMID